MDNYLKRLFRRLSRRYRSTPPGGSIVQATPYFYMDSTAQMRDYYRLEKKREIVPLKKFVSTGSIMHGQIEGKLTEDGIIQVIGQSIDDRKVIFTMDKEKLTIDSKRGSHVKKTLTRLAEREGLELVVSTPKVRALPGINIVFWKFKNREEVDDSELVSKAQPDVDAKTAEMPTVNDASQDVVSSMQEYVRAHQERMIQAQQIQQRWTTRASSIVLNDAEIPF